MRKSTRTLIALTAAVSFTAAACGSDETPVDDVVDTVVEDTDEVVDSVVDDTEDVADTVVDDAMEDEVTEDDAMEDEVVTTEG